MAPAVAFDLYGTLLDVSGMARALEAAAPSPQALAERWRRHQLEISWLLSLMDRYEDFDAVTAYALDATLAEAGIELGSRERAAALAAAAALEPHDDAARALDMLAAEGFPLAVLSNGAPATLETLLRRSGLRARFEHVISADEVRVFKPAPQVYRYAAERLARSVEDVWLVSANPFDCAGAKACGMRVAKVERIRSFDYAFAPGPDIAAPSLAAVARTLATEPPRPAPPSSP